MSVSAAVQYGTRKPWAPSVPTLRRWAAAGLAVAPRSSWIGIRIVDTAESRKLNRRYRHQDKPTNVLSFEAEPVRRQGECFLGDLVICAPVVAREARAQVAGAAAAGRGRAHRLAQRRSAFRGAASMKRCPAPDQVR